ncbi:hypothetical protein O9K51_01868 [Purpureocillium lavendulum]|uniref:Uncharacterized protein n=1 Tax=Purpureocillium lavendulum TaxID=1247861 RepID=A0AB34G7V0_9HYPO|nr:hypothetical protein O9K51_01868 [Purpureocillium lavendulum]
MYGIIFLLTLAFASQNSRRQPSWHWALCKYEEALRGVDYNNRNSWGEVMARRVSSFTLREC